VRAARTSAGQTPARRTNSARAAERISVAEALNDQFAWLAHQATGTSAVKRKALHHIEDAGQTEIRTQTDYVGRFAIELLQNAHDACADAQREGAVRFVLTPTALLVANEGQAFDGPRIVSLVRQGSSEKVQGAHGWRTIGYKGVGFSSVFEISDQPQVVSAEAKFQCIELALSPGGVFVGDCGGDVLGERAGAAFVEVDFDDVVVEGRDGGDEAAAVGVDGRRGLAAL
jgi:hypothetical protein